MAFRLAFFAALVRTWHANRVDVEDLNSLSMEMTRASEETVHVSSSKHSQLVAGDPEPSEILFVKTQMCFILHKQAAAEEPSGVAEQLEKLRKKDTFPGFGFKVHDALVESFGCGAKKDMTDASFLQKIVATGKSGSAAMKTKNKLFRLKELLEDEYRFWREGGFLEHTMPPNQALVNHWLSGQPTTMAKYYAFVKGGHGEPGKEARVWIVMLNAFAGIADMSSDKQAQIFDLKGSGRKCKEEEGKTCGKDLELKEKDFDASFPGGLNIFHSAYASGSNDDWSQHGKQGGYTALMNALGADVSLLKSLKIHDYSMVMRVTKTAPMCPGIVDEDADSSEWRPIYQCWVDPQSFFGGAGSEFYAMAGLDQGSYAPVRITLVTLDYLQDSTTLHNQAASSKWISGSKIPSPEYADRFLGYMQSSFHPMILLDKVEETTESNGGPTVTGSVVCYDHAGTGRVDWDNFKRECLRAHRDEDDEANVAAIPILGDLSY